MSDQSGPDCDGGGVVQEPQLKSRTLWRGLVAAALLGIAAGGVSVLVSTAVYGLYWKAVGGLATAVVALGIAWFIFMRGER